MTHLKNTKVILIIMLLIPAFASISQEINQQKVQELIKYNDSLYASEVLILHKGKKIVYWSDTTCDISVMYTASMLKSWTGLAFGTLIDHGFIKNIDQKVCEWLPEWADGCAKNVTLRHLLTMSAGFRRRGGNSGVLAQSDNNLYVLNSKLDYSPGMKFDYSNESVQLLGIILERASGMDADSYFEKYLFQPLEMNSTHLVRDRSGKNWVTYGGCITTINDVSKIGQLVLNKGKFGDRQVISEKWISESLQPSSLASYYGYLWWLDYKYSAHQNISAMGDPGNMMIIFPKSDLIFIRSQTCKTDLNSHPEYCSSKWMGVAFINKISGIMN